MKKMLAALIATAVLTGTATPSFPATTTLVNQGEYAMSESVTRDLVVTRVFDTSVDQVWKAWSDGEYVMKWWGPKGFTSPSSKMDFREGGTSLVCMRAPKEFGGFDMFNSWTYEKIIPNKSIEFVLHFTDKDGNRLDPAKMGLPPGIPNGVRHVITFKQITDRKTEMTVTEYGYTTDQAHDTSKAGLEECLDKMAVIFTTPGN